MGVVDRLRQTFGRLGPAFEYLTARKNSPYGRMAKIEDRLKREVKIRSLEDAQLMSPGRSIKLATAGSPKNILYGPKIAQGHSGMNPVSALMYQKYGEEADVWQQFEYYSDCYKHIPILRAAIENRMAINGVVNIESKDEGLQRELRDVWDNLNVGYFRSNSVTKGGDAYLNALRLTGDKYGMGIGEIAMAMNASRTRFMGIDRLLLPSIHSFGVRKTFNESAGGNWLYDIIQFTEQGHRNVGVEEEDFPGTSIASPFISTVAYRCDPDSIWPLPLIYGMRGAVENLIRLYISSGNTITRAGQPSKIHTFTESGEEDIDVGALQEVTLPDQTTTEIPLPVANFHEQLEIWAREVFWGNSADMALYLKGLDFETHDMFENTVATSIVGELESMMRIFEAQVINASGTPPALYGFGDSAGQGMQSNKFEHQMGVAMLHAVSRRKQDKSVVRQVLDWALIAEGQGRFMDRYSVEFDTSGLLNENGMQETRLTKAQADSAFLDNALAGSGIGVETDETGAPMGEGVLDMESYLIENGVIRPKN